MKGMINMGFKDYRKFSNKHNDQNKDQNVIQNNEEVNTNIDTHNAEIIPLDNTDDVELKVELKTKGVVIASRLNVRKEASKEAEVLTIISKGTGVGINLTKSTDEFYCVDVVVNGEFTTGYAMKEFITINE